MNIKNLMVIGAFSLVALSLPAIAVAQYNNPNDPYNRNGGYNNGNYGNSGYGGDIGITLRDLKDRSKYFKKDVDHQNGYSNVYSDRYLRDLADQFKGAVNSLESKYRPGRDEYRSSNEARRVLDIGAQLDQELYRGRSDRFIRNEWDPINNDLRILANTYGFNNGNNGNYRNYPTNQYPPTVRVSVPFWWPF
jgi:hypothetical protein